MRAENKIRKATGKKGKKKNSCVINQEFNTINTAITPINQREYQVAVVLFGSCINFLNTGEPVEYSQGLATLL